MKNTQDIQEWEKEWEALKKNFIAVQQNEWWSSDEDFIKSFISQKLKEQEERHKREIEELQREIRGYREDLSEL